MATQRPGLLGRLGGAAFRHRYRVLALWAVALVAFIGLSGALKGEFSADYSAPQSDSSVATHLLEERFPEAGTATVDLVVHAPSGVTSPATRTEIQTLISDIAAANGVSSIDDAFTQPGMISADGQTLHTQVRLTTEKPEDVAVADTQGLLAIASAAEHEGFQVALGGQPVALAQAPPIGSEMIGLLAAIIILLLTFGSVVAAGLPVLTALIGLGVSSMLTGLIAAVMPVPDWATSLATMVGLGVGIDYALLMVTRFREWRAAGLDPEAATVATMDTAGRAVLLAGSTVIISMLGLFAMGLSFMRGASVVTIGAVVVVLVASITLFPALLSIFGTRVDSLRLPLRRRPTVDAVTPGWLRWGRLIERNRVAAMLIGIVILLGLASPFLGVRFGFPDAGNDAVGTSTRTAYDLSTSGFGPGANGPLVLVADVSAGTSPGDASGAIAHAVRNMAATPGVALVTAPVFNAAGDTAVFTVIPKTGPQDVATEELVGTLRDSVLPGAMAGTGIDIHVGGITAAAIDSTENISRRIPLLIGGVVGLSLVLLLVAFRSIAVALKAAAMNLLSVAAAYGVAAFALQGGWFGQLFGIDSPTPLPAFIPVLMFAVLFGLSMDYEVFLVARMREAWMSTRDNATAVVRGLAGTARVITAAAAIMIAVFAAFIPSPELALKVIGIGMASAILIDATVVRLLLVPAVMHLLGDRNWWIPAWLDRWLPKVSVEGYPDSHLPAEEPLPVGA